MAPKNPAKGVTDLMHQELLPQTGPGVAEPDGAQRRPAVSGERGGDQQVTDASELREWVGNEQLQIVLKALRGEFPVTATPESHASDGSQSGEDKAPQRSRTIAASIKEVIVGALKKLRIELFRGRMGDDLAGTLHVFDCEDESGCGHLMELEGLVGESGVVVACDPPGTVMVEDCVGVCWKRVGEKRVQVEVRVHSFYPHKLSCLSKADKRARVVGTASIFANVSRALRPLLRFFRRSKAERRHLEGCELPAGEKCGPAFVVGRQCAAVTAQQTFEVTDASGGGGLTFVPVGKPTLALRRVRLTHTVTQEQVDAFLRGEGTSTAELAVPLLVMASVHAVAASQGWGAESTASRSDATSAATSLSAGTPAAQSREEAAATRTAGGGPPSTVCTRFCVEHLASSAVLAAAAAVEGRAPERPSDAVDVSASDHSPENAPPVSAPAVEPAVPDPTPAASVFAHTEPAPGRLAAAADLDAPVEPAGGAAAVGPAAAAAGGAACEPYLLLVVYFPFGTATPEFTDQQWSEFQPVVDGWKTEVELRFDTAHFDGDWKVLCWHAHRGGLGLRTSLKSVGIECEGVHAPYATAVQNEGCVCVAKINRAMRDYLCLVNVRWAAQQVARLHGTATTSAAKREAFQRLVEHWSAMLAKLARRRSRPSNPNPSSPATDGSGGAPDAAPSASAAGEAAT